MESILRAIDVDYISAISKNCRHDFFWLTAPIRPEKPSISIAVNLNYEKNLK